MMLMVNAFNEIYNKILGEHHSGWSDDQLKEHTWEVFYKIVKSISITSTLGSFEEQPKVESKRSSIYIVEQRKNQRE